MTNVIVIDDDITQTTLVKTILTKFGFGVVCFNNPEELISNYHSGMADIILSDVYMPQMGGFDLIKIIREKDPCIPFIMFTSSEDIKNVISLCKRGISDYILKPVVPDDIVHRIDRVLQEVKQKQAVKKINSEKELIDLEKSKLNNWRELYANKDITQTQQMMQFLSRSLNSGCGYVWLDILNDLPKQEDGSVVLDSDLYNLVTESANGQKKVFDYLDFVNNLPNPQLEDMTIETFVNELKNYYDNSLIPLFNKNKRKLSVNLNIYSPKGRLNVDRETIENIVWELSINSIKFSPENSEIIMDLYTEARDNMGIIESANKNWLIFEIRNQPKEVHHSDNSNNPIIGIPYDYIEMVYDLFYTIEPFPVINEDERWSNGTGLYIVRNMAKKMNSWVSCKNIIDYRDGKKTPYVLFTYMIPVL